MTPVTDAIRAHQRLIESLPRERIRTHHHQPLPERIQGRRLGDVPEGLIEEVRRLMDGGASRESICRTLRMGDRLYRRIRTIIESRGK